MMDGTDMQLIDPVGVTPVGRKIYYGWWIAAAAFLNLFFTTGIIYYGFPIFYPSFVGSLGFTRAQVTQGFLLGFIFVGLPFGYVAGILIDKIGARRVILFGIVLISVPLILMGFMKKLWQYETLCCCEVLGYVFAGPIANQVLVARWFRIQRGRAMGIAYLGLGLGGVISPSLTNGLIRSCGWRHTLEIVGILIGLVLIPVGLFVTRSTPAEMNLLPDGEEPGSNRNKVEQEVGTTVRGALKTTNFWLILVGSALVIGAINTVIQHLVLLLVDVGYSKAAASHVLSGLMTASLAGRIVVGHLADRVPKRIAMAFFYCVIGAAIPLLFFIGKPLAAWSFAAVFGFAMGADYMLIPLLTAECFGLTALGRLLALIIMGYSVGQWVAPWVAGRLFDVYHTYNGAWKIMSVCSILGAAAIYAVKISKKPIVGNSGA